jgi:hypothetical protein
MPFSEFRNGNGNMLIIYAFLWCEDFGMLSRFITHKISQLSQQFSNIREKSFKQSNKSHNK